MEGEPQRQKQQQGGQDGGSRNAQARGAGVWAGQRAQWGIGGNGLKAHFGGDVPSLAVGWWGKGREEFRVDTGVWGVWDIWGPRES